MLGLSNKFNKRAVFPRGQQSQFLEDVKNRLDISLVGLARLAGVHVRSVTDWRREKFSMSMFALEALCEEAGINLPKNIEIRDPFWYTSLGSSAGGFATYRKYGHVGGDPGYRKRKWREWWEKEGRFNPHPIINVSLPIHKPPRSVELAELTGIILGDGGITYRQVTITLHRFDDTDFVTYVRDLFCKLFNVEPSIYERRGEMALSIVVSRTELVHFLINMGLKIGGKVRQQVDIPQWIKLSDDFTKFCLRGLFDTDGCFYIDRHHYKDKVYLNCGMNFTNRSLPILNFFKAKLERFGFHPTRNTKFSISLRVEKDIVKYFEKIGSSNSKHTKKFTAYFKNKYGEVPKWS
jgi:hypothetical protein